MVSSATTDHPFVDPLCHRLQAAAMFATAWKLLNLPLRSSEQDVALLLAAHAYEHHASLIGDDEAPVRGALLLARVHLALGKPQPALEDARSAARRCRGTTVCGCLRVEAQLAAVRAAQAAGLMSDANHHRQLAITSLSRLTSDPSRVRLERELEALATHS